MYNFKEQDYILYDNEKYYISQIVRIGGKTKYIITNNKDKLIVDHSYLKRLF